MNFGLQFISKIFTIQPYMYDNNYHDMRKMREILLNKP